MACAWLDCSHHHEQKKLSHMHSAVWSLWRSVGPQFGGRWHEIIWEALHSATMWACFSRPSTLASCGVRSAKNALLVRREGAKVAALRHWQAHHLRPRRRRLSAVGKEPLAVSQWLLHSHGRTSTRNVISRPAPCFLLEYTVFPVCCYHLSLCAKETQGSEDLSSGRAEVICFPKRHFRVLASFGGPS